MEGENCNLWIDLAVKARAPLHGYLFQNFQRIHVPTFLILFTRRSSFFSEHQMIIFSGRMTIFHEDAK